MNISLTVFQTVVALLCWSLIIAGVLLAVLVHLTNRHDPFSTSPATEVFLLLLFWSGAGVIAIIAIT